MSFDNDNYQPKLFYTNEEHKDLMKHCGDVHFAWGTIAGAVGILILIVSVLAIGWYVDY